MMDTETLKKLEEIKTKFFDFEKLQQDNKNKEKQLAELREKREKIENKEVLAGESIAR